MALGDLNEKQLLGLTAGIVGGILLVMAGILFWTYTRYTGLLNEIKAKNDTAAKMEEKARTLNDIKDVHDAAINTHYETLKRVPEGDQTTELNAQISEQAVRAKLRILKIELVKERSNRGRGRGRGEQQQSGKLGKIQIHIEAVGGFNSFGQFLNNIEEHMARFVAVTGFSITAYEEGLVPGKRAHEITLDLVTYKYAGEENRPAATGAATTAGR